MDETVIRQETLLIRGTPVTFKTAEIGGLNWLISGHWLRTAHLGTEKDVWLADVPNPEEVVQSLKSLPLRVDLLQFWQRIPDSEPKFGYYHETRQIAAIPIIDYKEWFEKKITPKARNKIRKTQKYGVKIQQEELNDELVRGIMGIFNQSPVRRGKRFWHYGKSFEVVKREMALDLNESIFVTAWHESELIGFIKLYLSDRYAMITLILDKTAHREKAPMNGMIAKAVEICGQRKIRFITYTVWRRGQHGQFQESVGFVPISVPEYFVPVSLRGRLALMLGLHKGVRGLIPEKMMVWLLALRAKWYSWKYKQSSE